MGILSTIKAFLLLLVFAEGNRAIGLGRECEFGGKISQLNGKAFKYGGFTCWISSKFKGGGFLGKSSSFSFFASSSFALKNAN